MIMAAAWAVACRGQSPTRLADAGSVVDEASSMSTLPPALDRAAQPSSADAQLSARLAFAPLIAEIRTDFGRPAQTELRVVGALAQEARLAVEKIESAEVSATLVSVADGGSVLVELKTDPPYSGQ